MADRKASVLVTGGNGFIASHIIAHLIESSFEVTASVRSQDKAEQLLKEHPTWNGKLHFGFVPELSKPNAFDKLFDKSYDYIIHTASPVSFQVNDIQKDLVDPAVQGTLGLFQSAQQLGGSQLKRFVLLGSAVAVLDSFEKEADAHKNYTEEDWNPVTAQDAVERNDAVLGYNASKKLAEQAAWKFMAEHKTTFDLTVLNPDIVIGPMIQPVPSQRSINETNKFAIYSFMDGTNKMIETVRFAFYHFVDVRDVAKAHVLAMTASSASNKRILLVSGLISPQLVVNTIRAHFPELRSRVAEGTPSQILPKGVHPTGWNVSRSHEILGKDWKYRPLEESVVDTVKNILDHERKWKDTNSK